MRQFCFSLFSVRLRGDFDLKMSLHRFIIISPSFTHCAFYEHWLSRRNQPGENFHSIEVAPFLGTKSSSEDDTLLLLSDTGLVSLLYALGNVNASLIFRNETFFNHINNNSVTVEAVIWHNYTLQQNWDSNAKSFVFAVQWRHSGLTSKDEFKIKVNCFSLYTLNNIQHSPF